LNSLPAKGAPSSVIAASKAPARLEYNTDVLSSCSRPGFAPKAWYSAVIFTVAERNPKSISQ